MKRREAYEGRLLRAAHSRKRHRYSCSVPEDSALITFGPSDAANPPHASMRVPAAPDGTFIRTLYTHLTKKTNRK